MWLVAYLISLLGFIHKSRKCCSENSWSGCLIPGFEGVAVFAVVLLVLVDFSA